MDAVKLRGFRTLTRIDTALATFFERVAVSRLPAEDVSSGRALGRVLADDVVAEWDVPGFDRSAVDGYAIRAEDTYGASRVNPFVFNILGDVAIGVPSSLRVGRQQAARIATGAPLPSGADAVVMVEDTECLEAGRVEVTRALTPGENVSRRGEDVTAGELILARGTVLQPQDIGMLVALGRRTIGVVRRPAVAVLSTGNELVEGDAEAGDGKVIDVNRPILMAMVQALGGDPVDLGIVADDVTAIQARIAAGVTGSDLVLVTGGTSVGAGDLVPDVIQRLGPPGVLVHGISMRPGRPAALAAVGRTPLVLLPGFPVAAMVAFRALVQPILVRMLGAAASQFAGQTVRARLVRRLPSSLGNRTFARVIVRRAGAGYEAEPLRTRGSGVISSMIRANGLVVIPEAKEGVEAGELVEVTLLRPLEE